MGGGRVDLRAQTGENFQANAAFGQTRDRSDQMVQAAPHAVELPDDQHVAISHGLQTRVQPRSLVLFARGPVRVDLVLANARGDQGVLLKVERLATVGLRDPGIAD